MSRTGNPTEPTAHELLLGRRAEEGALTGQGLFGGGTSQQRLVLMAAEGNLVVDEKPRGSTLPKVMSFIICK